MNTLDQLLELNDILLDEMPQYRQQALLFGKDRQNQWNLFRSLVNIRPAMPASREFIELQDALLQGEIEKKGITNVSDLTPVHDNLYLWHGDITTLKAGAIVNAANSGLTGCYHPCHGCIDNAIHTYAGVQLRLECVQLVEKQGFPEPTGRAKIPGAYNLPCEHVIHTVGPIISGALSQEDRRLLASCYRSCLDVAVENHMSSIDFCCISTGEFHFPPEEAANIALRTVMDYKKENNCSVDVIFNVFTDRDYNIYKQLINCDFC